ncbi:MAG: hypothetical protein HY791_04980 [Deltaproteobacteria bacterium]|nr:hypothetical protein [Deltaproteobacteria bacterium]
MSTVSSSAPTPTPPIQGSTPAAPPSAPAAPVAAEAAEAPAPVDAVVTDSVAVNAAKAAVSGPVVPAKVSLAGVPEQFPIADLSKLEAKGLAGQVFMLDGGALRGQKLEVRRVKDGEEPGFEILLRLAPEKIAALEESLTKAGGSKCSVEFRGLELGPDGTATYTAAKGALAAGSTHAPKDLDSAATQWATRASSPKGGSVEVVGQKAALAVRGLVRIQLRGDDKVCTQQLQNVVKSFGLGHLFAPPTPKAKQKHILMRALWQADQKTAKELSKDLEKLKPEDISKALEAVGYTPERIAGLKLEEVFPGHFSVVDPMQPKVLAEAGARYLYSTVTEPAHVLSILRGGQKASLQRYKEGMIINGMSTNADFVTGGAVGVFTRLVTQAAIYDGQAWTGRTYKLLQTHEQLARTDWYGWNGDFYGRRWELETEKNFGVGLVKSVDQGGYKTTNEFIFSAGNSAKNIQRVIATTEDARQKLLELLKKESYVPHNGLSLEDFVVLSPKFLVFGPSPYTVDDPKAFGAQAVEKAKAGDTTPLRWFLTEGPKDQGARAELEKSLLLGDDTNLRGFVLKAATVNGTFAMDGATFDTLATELEGKGDPGKAIKSEVMRNGEALFRSGSEKAHGWLVESKPQPSTSSYSTPYSIPDDSWVRILSDLFGSSGVERKAFDLAVEVAAPRLLQNRHAGFLAFLTDHPLLTPADPKAWLEEQMAEVKAGKTQQMSLYLAQTKADQRGPLHELLLRSNDNNGMELAWTSIGQHRSLGLDGPAAKALLEALPADGPARTRLINSYADILLKLGDPALFETVTKAHQSPTLGIHDATVWKSVLDSLEAQAGGVTTAMARDVMERAAYRLSSDASFLAKVAKNPTLYTVEAPETFIAEAGQNIAEGKPGALKMIWALTGSSDPAVRKRALGEALARNDCVWVLDRIKTPDGKLPFSPDELRDVAKDVLGLENKVPARNLLQRVGATILTHADAGLLEKLDAFAKTEGLGALGLQGGNVVVTLRKLDEVEGADAKLARDWLLRRGADLVKGSSPEFLAYLVEKKLTLGDLGQDATWAANVVKESVANLSYYWTNPSYASYEQYQKVPEMAAWLVRGGGESFDETVLKAIEDNIKSWKWDKNFVPKFLEKMAFPAEWTEKIQKAAKTGWFS